MTTDKFYEFLAINWTINLNYYFTVYIEEEKLHKNKRKREREKENKNKGNEGTE